MKKEIAMKKTLIALLLILCAVLSFFVAAQKATATESYDGTIASIDQKTKQVLALSASAVVISTGISALRDDMGSPIADKLADFTGYFLLILCVLYTEKNALTILGFAVFKIIIPIACLLGIYSVFKGSNTSRRVAWKLAVFSLAVFAAIPISLRVSDMVYENHKEIVEIALTDTNQMDDQSTQISEAGGDKSKIASLFTGWKETISGFINKGAQIVNQLVESIAVFVVTTCVIPLLVLVFILWLVKVLFGVAIAYPNPRRWRKTVSGVRGTRK